MYTSKGGKVVELMYILTLIIKIEKKNPIERRKWGIFQYSTKYKFGRILNMYL